MAEFALIVDCFIGRSTPTKRGCCKSCVAWPRVVQRAPGEQIERVFETSMHPFVDGQMQRGGGKRSAHDPLASDWRALDHVPGTV